MNNKMRKNIRKLIELWIYTLHKNDNKIINYRKTVTSLFNSCPKPVVYCWKNRCKKSVVIKIRRIIFFWWTLKKGHFPRGRLLVQWVLDNLVKYFGAVVYANFFKLWLGRLLVFEWTFVYKVKHSFQIKFLVIAGLYWW